MAALMRPLGDAIAAIYGAELYLATKDLKHMKVGDRYEVLCEDGLHYMVGVKELHGSNHGKLHFFKWNRKFDYTGFLEALYIAPMNTFSKGLLNVSTNQYSPSEIMEGPARKRSLKRAVESLSSDRKLPVSDEPVSNTDQSISRSISSIDPSPAHVFSHGVRSDSVKLSSKQPKQTAQSDTIPLATVVTPFQSTATAPVSHVSLRSAVTESSSDSMQSKKVLNSSQKSNKSQPPADEGGASGRKRRSLEMKCDHKGGGLKTMITADTEASPTRASKEASATRVKLSADKEMRVELELRDAPRSSRSVELRGDMAHHQRSRRDAMSTKKVKVDGQPAVDDVPSKTPGRGRWPSDRKVIAKRPIIIIDDHKVDITPNVIVDAARESIRATRLMKKSHRLGQADEVDAGGDNDDDDASDHFEASDDHSAPVDSLAVDATIPQPGAPTTGRRKTRGHEDVVAECKSSSSLSIPMTDPLDAASSDPIIVPSAPPPLIRAAVVEDRDHLRTRTRYPVGYLDKPRLFAGSKRRRSDAPYALLQGAVTPAEDDESVGALKAMARGAITSQSLVDAMDGSQQPLNPRIEQQFRDRLVSIKGHRRPYHHHQHQHADVDALCRDTLQAMDWLAETGLRSTRPIFGPVCMLLQHRLADASLAAVVEDLLSLEALLAFVVTSREDESFYRRRFRQKRISNALHFIDPSYQPLPQLIRGAPAFTHNSTSCEEGWMRQCLIDRLYHRSLDGHLHLSSTQSDSVMRLFLCAEFGFHRITYVEAMRSHAPKSYLFATNEDDGYIDGGDDQKVAMPFTLYCKTWTDRPVDVTSASTMELSNQRPGDDADVAWVITRYSCPIPPNLAQLDKEFAETGLQSRTVFAASILSLKPFEDMLLRGIDSSPPAMKTAGDGVCGDRLEIVYPSMVEVTVGAARSIPMNMKAMQMEDNSAPPSILLDDGNSVLRPIDRYLPIPIISKGVPGFWFPANARGYRNIAAISDNWIDEPSHRSEDGWFFSSRSLVHPSDDGSSSNCLQAGCLSLKKSRPWAARKGIEWLPPLDHSSLEPMVVSDASLDPPNQLFVAFTTSASYQAWRQAVADPHRFPSLPIDVPPHRLAAIAMAGVHTHRKPALVCDFHWIASEDALVWSPPYEVDEIVDVEEDEIDGKSNDHQHQQLPLDHPRAGDNEACMGADEGVGVEGGVDPAVDGEHGIHTIPVAASAIDPVARAVQCLDIDGIARTHREAIEAFRSMQPALEARGVRAPHLLLLLAAQLELAEATRLLMEQLQPQHEGVGEGDGRLL